jgi:TolB protein
MSVDSHSRRFWRLPSTSEINLRADILSPSAAIELNDEARARVTMAVSPFRPAAITRRSAVAALFATLVLGPLRARIVTDDESKISIAVPDFLGGSSDEIESGRGVAAAMVSDLRTSGRFTSLDPTLYRGTVRDFDTVPQFAEWQAVGAEVLVTGRLGLQPDRRFKVEFRLWDVSAGELMEGAQYFVAPSQWDLVPHIIADAVYERLTGQAAQFEGQR